MSVAELVRTTHHATTHVPLKDLYNSSFLVRVAPSVLKHKSYLYIRSPVYLSLYSPQNPTNV